MVLADEAKGKVAAVKASVEWVFVGKVKGGTLVRASADGGHYKVCHVMLLYCVGYQAGPLCNARGARHGAGHTHG